MSTSDYLALLGADEATISALETAGDLVPGRVTRAEHSLITVLTPAGQLRAALGHTELPCSGDWVLINVADPSSPAVARVLPRRTALVRHATGKQSVPQTLAANMDDVFVTVAADRDVSLDRIERFLTLVWESGASPVVVLTKSDLLPPGAGGPLLTAAMNVAPGAEVYLVSVVTGDGIDELSVRLRPNRTAALIGSSGAGKSSLLNAMAGANVAVMANSAMPIGRCEAGSFVRINVKAIGISTPPVKPWMARRAIISCRLCAKAQAIENIRNRTALVSRNRLNENTRLR